MEKQLDCNDKKVCNCRGAFSAIDISPEHLNIFDWLLLALILAGFIFGFTNTILGLL